MAPSSLMLFLSSRTQAVAYYEYESYPDTDDELMAAEWGENSSMNGSVVSTASGLGSEAPSQAGVLCVSLYEITQMCKRRGD